MRLVRSSNSSRSVRPGLPGAGWAKSSSAVARAGPSGRLPHQPLAEAQELGVLGHRALSQRSSTIAPTPGSRLVKTKIRPEAVSRPARFSIVFLPDLRSNSTAFSASPPASVKARLQSIIGSPVCSRRALTAAAVISGMENSSFA